MFEKLTLSSKIKIAFIYLSLKIVGSNKHANTEKRLRICMLIRRGIFLKIEFSNLAENYDPFLN